MEQFCPYITTVPDEEMPDLIQERSTWHDEEIPVYPLWSRYQKFYVTRIGETEWGINLNRQLVVVIESRPYRPEWHSLGTWTTHVTISVAPRDRDFFMRWLLSRFLEIITTRVL